MSIDRDAVIKIAKLSRIKLNESEIDKTADDLTEIFNWIEQLSEVPTEDIIPMAGVGEYTLRQREDIINDGNIRDDVLKNSPESEFGCYVVPKVIE